MHKITYKCPKCENVFTVASKKEQLKVVCVHCGEAGYLLDEIDEEETDLEEDPDKDE